MPVMNRIEPTTEQERALKEYADVTQALLPNVNDSIKIENPDGHRWIVMHMPSREEERARQANQMREILVWFAWVVAVIGVYLVILPFMPHHHVPPGQHQRDVKSFGAGIVVLALAAWLTGCKRKVKVNASR